MVNDPVRYDHYHHSSMSHLSTDGQSQLIQQQQQPGPAKPMPGIFSGISDRVLKASGKLLTSPYDLDSWNILIKDAQVRNYLILFIILF